MKIVAVSACLMFLCGCASSPEASPPQVAERVSPIEIERLGDAVRRQALSKTVTTPNDAEAWFALASTYFTGHFGRAYASGSDLTKARQAYMRASELAPDAVEPRRMLALLDLTEYAYTPAGTRPDFAAAIARSEEVLRRTRDEPTAGVLVMALFFGEVDAKIAAQCAAYPELDAIDPFCVASAAINVSPARALSLAQERSGENEAETVQNAAQLVLLRGSYDRALPLLAHARDAAISLFPAEQLALRLGPKLVPLKLTAEPRDESPEEVVRQVAAWFIVDGPSAPGVRARMSAALQKDDSRPYWLATALPRSVFGGTNDRTVRMLHANLVASAMTFSVEGDDVVGRKVTVKETFADLSAERGVAYYLVHEDGRHAVVSVGGNPWELGAQALRFFDAGNVAAGTRWLAWADLVVHPSKDFEEDPAAGSLFRALFKPGASPDDLALAAAALAATGSDADSARLLALLERGSAAAVDDRMKARFARARATLFLQDKNHDAALETLTRVAPLVERSAILRRIRYRTLLALERFDEVQAETAAVLARLPGDPSAVRAHVERTVRVGTPDEVRAAYREQIDAGVEKTSAQNNLAWSLLFLDPPKVGEGIAIAEDARRAKNGERPALLNTLAALYAEAGRLKDAWDLLEKIDSIQAPQDLTEGDWYVVGRVYEQLSLVDDAREAYAHVKEHPESTDRFPVWTLAQKRLAILNAAQAAGPAQGAPSGG